MMLCRYFTSQNTGLQAVQVGNVPNGKYVYRYGYAFLLMLNTGIRLGEALYLKWEDVDFETNTIYIHGNVSEHKSREKGETKYIIEEQHTPKTKKSVRYVSLNKNAAEALRKLKEIVNDDKSVIATEEHTIVSPHNMHRIFSSILRKCNITGVNDIVHSLRHTFATTLILKGEDINELLGHSDVGTIVIISYGHTHQSSYILITKRNIAFLKSNVPFIFSR